MITGLLPKNHKTLTVSQLRSLSTIFFGISPFFIPINAVEVCTRIKAFKNKTRERNMIKGFRRVF
jgi:hypothetical protein